MQAGLDFRELVLYISSSTVVFQEGGVVKCTLRAKHVTSLGKEGVLRNHLIVDQ